MKPYKKYKDSGIEWIGEIPEHWEVKKIKHNTYLKARVGWKGLRSDEFLDEGFAYLLTGTDLKNGNVDWEHSYFIDEVRYDDDPFIQLKENDLLITKDGTIGKVAIVDKLNKPACLNSGVFVMRPLNKEWETKYLFNVLSSNVFKSFIDLTSYGSTILHLYQNVFNEFQFPLPPIKDQNAIIKYLDTKTTEINQNIADKEKLIALFEEEKKALINQAVTKGLNPKAKLKPSGIDWLGDIPEHWEVKRVKHVLQSLNTKRVPLSSEERGIMTERVYDYYGASGIIDKVENYIFDEPLILVGEDGANLLSRSTRLAFIAEGKYWVNNHAHILKPIIGEIKFYCELLENYDFSIWVTGSAQPKLTSENLMNIKFIVPPIKEQSGIVNHIDKISETIDNKISITNQEIELLKEYSAALIFEAVTGKIDITNN